MINIYIIRKSDGKLVAISTGEPEDVLRDIAEDHDFTLEKPPQNGTHWLWDGMQWVKDNSEEVRLILQKNTWEAIKGIRQKIVESGVLVPSIGKVFQTDQNSMTQYANIASMIALDNYTPVQWKTFDNTWVTLTVELFKELQQAIRQRTDRVFAIAEEHKAKLMESDNPEDYDYTVGWIESISENKETQ